MDAGFQPARRLGIALVAAIAVGGCHRGAEPIAETASAPVGAADLCLTRGSVERLRDDVLSVRVPVLRGEVPGETETPIEVEFVYDGPTREVEPLANGELRREIGLKLRARDSCNVVYVVWKIEPVSEIAVLVKANPDDVRPEECGDRGYRRLVPEEAHAVAPIRIGEARRLRGDLEGRMLVVAVDGEPAWRGELPDEAFAFDGPIGVRTDNARFRFRLAGAHGPIGSSGGKCEAHASR